MAVRAKFSLEEVHSYVGGRQKFLFAAVCDGSTPEDRKFQKYTPSGQLSILVDNPLAQQQFEVGKKYYLDFSPCD